MTSILRWHIQFKLFDKIWSALIRNQTILWSLKHFRIVGISLCSEATILKTLVEELWTASNVFYTSDVQLLKKIIDGCVSHLSLSFYHKYRGYDYLIPVIFLSEFYLLLLIFFWVTCCGERQGNTRDLLSVQDNYNNISQYQRILRACLRTTGFFIKKKNTRYEPITQNCQHKEQLIHEFGKNFPLVEDWGRIMNAALSTVFRL